jgi:Uma2 family endonuclease
MVDSRRKEATYQDVLDAPEHLVAEIIDGELFLSPRPAMPHTLAAGNLFGELFVPFSKGGNGGPGGWIIAPEPELHFGKNVVVPDIAGWRRERLPVVENVNYMELAPDWLCEALSRSTEKLDRLKKMRVYARAGVPHVWLLDQRNRRVEIYQLEDGHYELIALFDETETVRAAPFDAIELPIADLFANLASRVGETQADYGR